MKTLTLISELLFIYKRIFVAQSRLANSRYFFKCFSLLYLSVFEETYLACLSFGNPINAIDPI